jgi:predicted MFS family arabinose efflux permease
MEAPVSQAMLAAQREAVPVWRATLSGLCANLVGVGLARFAYTPIIPVLIAAQWFGPSQAAYLGAANLAGYLVGALAVRRLGQAAPSTLLRAMMLVAAASFFACAFPQSFAWYFAWRFVAGFAGGALMVVAAPAILPHVPEQKRGAVSGAIFAGVGLGIAASGTVVAVLLSYGLVETWLSLGALALLLTAAAWGGWPRGLAPTTVRVDAPQVDGGASLTALQVEYGLAAVGLVPHMVFLVDFIARGAQLGIEIGARYWVVFGVAAIAGPLLLGALADRVGFRPTLRLLFALDAAAVLLVAFTVDPAALAASTVVVGASVSGVVPLALGRVRELVGDDAGQRRAWSACTIAFAIGQAAAAYAMSYVFARREGTYAVLFAIGAGAFVLALAIDVAANARRQTNDTE